MTTVYLAAPLFTLAEQDFNARLRDELVAYGPRGLTVILPQERSKALLALPDGLELVFKDCIEMIDACDAVVAIVDGPDADSGTCVEIGYAFAKKKPIIGVRTDFRASEDRGVNLMVSHAAAVLVQGADSVAALASKIAAALEVVTGRIAPGG